jgi:hypothetical protein
MRFAEQARMHTILRALLFAAVLSCSQAPRGGSVAPGREVLTLPAPAPAGGDLSLRQHPNLARGRAEKYADDWSEVDSFNGTLSLRVPLGLRYPTGGRLSGYQLELSYSSSIWDFSGSATGGLSAVPNPASDAGLGWQLRFGRLLPPSSAYNQSARWIYLDGDGGAHPFYSQVHGSDTDPTETPGASPHFGYTRDGTYLRMHELAADLRAVEMPDGTWEEYSQSNSSWRLTRRADGLGNFFTIAYGDGTHWTLADSTGRTAATLTFAADPAGYYAFVLTRIDFAAAGGTLGSYLFSYDASSIARSCENDNPALAATAAVPLLRAITLPDGSQQKFSYFTGAASCRDAGRLAQRTLPTLGSHSFTYSNLTFPAMDCSVYTPPYRLHNVGVATRSALDAGGNLQGRWSWSWQQNGGTQGACPAPKEWVATLLTPSNNRTVWHFSIDSTSEYGLPFGRLLDDGTGTRFLSLQVFACASGCAPLRSTFVRYEQDASCAPASGSCANQNRRLASVRVRYEDDGATVTDVNSSNYDGLGHYRAVTKTGTTPPAVDRVKTTNYNPASGTWPATFQQPPAVSPWVLDTYSSLRVAEGTSTLQTDFCYTPSGFLQRKRVQKNASAGPGASDVVVEYLAGAAGDDARESWFGGDLQTVPATADVCALSTAGLAAQYRIDHGYSSGSLASSRYVSPAGTAVSYLSLDRTIDASTGLTSSERDTSGILTVYLYDSSGRQIWKQLSPGEGAWTRDVYAAATATTAASRTTTQEPPGGGAPYTTVLEQYGAFGRKNLERRFGPQGNAIETDWQYDTEGRLLSVSVPGAPGARPRWVHGGYDPFGRAGSRALADQLTTFTYAGDRLVSETAHPAVDVASTLGGQVVEMAPEVWTIERDRRGNVWRKTHQHTDANGAQLTDVSQFDHDANGNQIQSQVNGALTAWATFDGRGFPVQALIATPSDDVQNHTSIAAQLDARGHAHETTDDAGHHFHDYDAAEHEIAVRDAANGGRLLKELVFGESGAAGHRAGRAWRAVGHNWFDSNSPFAGSDVKVATESVFDGPLGRPNALALKVEDATGVAREFDQLIVHDDLGEELRHDHPACVTCASPSCTNCSAAGPGPAHSDLFTYRGGYLASVAGSSSGTAISWAPLVAYGTAGQLTQLGHGNGVTDFWDPDSGGLPRVSAIRTTGYANASASDTGAYQYDATGNVVRIGADYQLPPHGSGLDAPAARPRTPPPYCAAGRALVPASYDDGVSADDCAPIAVQLKDAWGRVVYIQDLYQQATPNLTWRLYGQDGKLLREFATDLSLAWRMTRDYVFRGDALLATEVRQQGDGGAAQIRHVHPRSASSDGAGNPVQ